MGMRIILDFVLYFAHGADGQKGKETPKKIITTHTYILKMYTGLEEKS